MISPLTYYHKIKNEQHVFIYCVAGRSSSTAFQRIINSSNAVWIWGEQHGIIDEAVALVNLMKKYVANWDNLESLVLMNDSYKNNKHLSFYPNAVGNLDTTINIVNSAVSNILKPWAYALKRFGFKDIDIKDIQTLVHLKEIFPQSSNIFCFRDPLTQWPSVHSVGWWKYCKELPAFLNEYYRISSIYLDFASKNDISAFIENNDLRDHSKIERIIKYLNISKVDSALINVTVNSAKVSSLSDAEKEIILGSNAYRNYLDMKNISKSFHKNKIQ